MAPKQPCSPRTLTLPPLIFWVTSWSLKGGEGHHPCWQALVRRDRPAVLLESFPQILWMQAPLAFRAKGSEGPALKQES